MKKSNKKPINNPVFSAGNKTKMHDPEGGCCDWFLLLVASWGGGAAPAHRPRGEAHPAPPGGARPHTRYHSEENTAQLFNSAHFGCAIFRPKYNGAHKYNALYVEECSILLFVRNDWVVDDVFVVVVVVRRLNVDGFCGWMYLDLKNIIIFAN